MSWLSKFLSFGLDFGSAPTDANRRILLTNHIAVAIGSCAFPYHFIFKAVGLTFLGNFIPVVCLCFLIPVGLNAFGFYRWAKLALVAVANLAAGFYAGSLGEASGVQHLFFAFLGASLVLFDENEKVDRAIGLVIPILFFFLLQINFHNYSFIYTYPVTPLATRVIYWGGSITAFIIIFLYQRFYYQGHLRFTKELLRINDQISRSYKDLQEGKEMSQKLKIQADYASMVRAIAHEIKNPLGMLKIRSELVLSRLEDHESIKKFADVIIRNVDRLNKLINTMLTYGAPITKDRVTFDVVDVLQHLEILMEVPCAKKYIKMRTDYGDVKPVYASKELIEQALINIVSNAIQYTPEGGEITLGVQEARYHDVKGNEREGAEIWIKDTGCGIKPELVESVFEPYVSSKVVGANMGLGLAFVYRVVGENEGKVRVETEQGKGTVFFVTVPVA